MRIKTIMRPAMVAALAAVVLFALGLPAALATTGQSGPSIPTVGDRVSAQAPIRIVSLPSATTGGTFTLTCGTGTTEPIPFDATATQVTNALKLVTPTCPGSPAASGRTVAPGTVGGPWKIQWATTAANPVVLSGTGTGLVPSGAVTVAFVQDGISSITGQVDPHGGYSSTTDYCLQCHAVHQGSAYSLLAASTVQAVCATCHGLFGATAGSGPRIAGNNGIGPGMAPFPGTVPGTASLRTAYDSSTPASGHAMGGNAPPYSSVSVLTETGWAYGSLSTDLNGKASNWASDEAAGPGTFTAGATTSAGGLYCGSCHTPHGEFGQLVNTRWYRSDVPAPYAINEVQTVDVGGLGGANTWTLTYKHPDGVTTCTTGSLAATAPASAVASALNGLSCIPGGVSVTGGPANSGTPFTVTFDGSGVTGVNQYPLTATRSAGATGAIVIATVKNGDSFDGTHEPVHAWQEGAPAYPGGSAQSTPGSPPFYLHLDASPVVWEKCPLDPQSAGYALTGVASAADTVVNTANPTAQACSYLTTSDSEGQTVYLYGYKLLSAYPNHSWADGPESWAMSNHSHDIARWCGRCHNQAVDQTIDATTTYHNHPTGCTSCHGNPNDFTLNSFDFPHTSAFGKLLKDYPDALCINCHVSGALP